MCQADPFNVIIHQYSVYLSEKFRQIWLNILEHVFPNNRFGFLIFKLRFHSVFSLFHPLPHPPKKNHNLISQISECFLVMYLVCSITFPYMGFFCYLSRFRCNISFKWIFPVIYLVYNITFISMGLSCYRSRLQYNIYLEGFLLSISFSV